MTEKNIKTSDILGTSYYTYSLSSSNYNPEVNGSITLTCTVKTVYGVAVNGKTITLYRNGSSVSQKTTNSNGVATWTYTCTNAGLQMFNVEDESIEVFVDNKAITGHTHNKSQITDLPTIPTDVSDLTDNSNTQFTPKSHTHGNLQNNGQVGSTAQASKNVVTDSSGKITTEDKPTIPSASSTTPSADTTSGSVGTGTTWARSNHTHPKSSLYAESSHTHDNYLTSHQDISGKANTSDLGAVAFSNDYDDLDNKPNIPSGVTVDTTLSSSSNNAIANSTVKNALDNKLDKTHTSYKGKNVVTNSSTGAIEFEDKNNHTHSNYLTSTDISGKIDTAGTGLSKSGTTLNHSNSVTALTTASLKKVKYDAQGHITGTSDVSASDLPSHTHDYSTFSGSYSDLTNKPSYTPTVTSSTTGAYKLGSINISGSSVDIYGKDTDTTQSLTNYLQTTDVKDNLTSTDTNKPLSAKQGKELKTLVDGKQATLISGTSIKTVNNESLLGSGNISISSGSNVDIVTAWESTLSDNKVASEKLVKDSLDEKVDSTHTHGNLSSDGKVSNSSSDTFQYFVGIGNSTNSLYKAYNLRADKVKDINEHINISTSANATQDTINTAIDSAINEKYSKNNIVTISSTNTVDLDNYTTSDFYIFAPINMLQYVSNAPSDLDDSVFYLLVERRDVNYVKQTLTSKMGITWVRTKISNTGWNRWREQQSGGNINSGVNLLGQWSSYSNCSTTPVRTYSLYHSEPIDQIINSGVSDTTKYTDFLWTIRPTDFSYNDVFTLSFYAKGTNAKNFKTYFYGGSGYIGVKRISSNSTVSNSIGISPSFGDGATEFTLGSDWQKYYVTYKLNSSGTASVDKKIAIRIFGGTDFYLNSPKLERGYNATDYTPSNNARNINYNIDFNDYKSEGHYWIWNSEQTSNTNAPDTQGGLLIVYNIPNGCIQLLYQYWSPEAKIYYRIYHSTAGWRNWQKLTSEWKIGADSGNTKDLDDYIYHGFYYNNVNTECAYISNLPESGKAFFLLVEDWGSSNYAKQTITHYGTNNTYTRIRNAGTWLNWEKLAKGGDVEYVVGTHGTTATSTWTGTCSKLREIKDGTIIYYYLTSAGVSGTNVTLNLTLPNGTTTGAKNVYFKGTTRLTTQYPINSIVALVYTTKRDSGAWYVASANDNNSYNAQEYGGVQIGAGESIESGYLCGAKKSDGKYYKLANGLVLDASKPIIQSNTSYTTSTTNTNNLYNKRYDMTVTTTKSMTLTAPKPVYIEGTSYTDGKFTISSNVLTQTLTSDRYYWLIGFAYDSTHLRFSGVDKKIYYYDGTNLVDANEHLAKKLIVDWDNIVFVDKTDDSTGSIILNFLT